MKFYTLADARVWYDVPDTVHGFSHIERVYHLCEHLGQAEGADQQIVLTAALMHDVASSARDEEQRRNHHLYSADFAVEQLSRDGWPKVRIDAVAHCIRAHRFRDETEMPETIEAKVLFDADKLDSIGAVGAARAIAYAAQHEAPFYYPPSASFLERGELAADEPHSSYHEYLFKLRNIRERLLTASGRSFAEERHAYMRDFYQRLAQEIEGIL
ncbi:MAG: HD domain-containing protein [Anaerolineaceae bacterium]|nr:HD domain-containing protein [Anaerolineaceae bacterium]